MSQTAFKLKRYYIALENLRRDTRHLVSMETYKGQGNMLVRTYAALHEAVRKILDDPYLDALVLDLPEDATERQQAVQVSILVGQLVAYVASAYEEAKHESETTDKQDNNEEVVNRFGNLMGDES